MASISNLAVIISGQTKPLEDAMKKAESKVSSFGKSFKEGIGLGAGVMGLDKLEGAMKKAIADNGQLAEAAEQAEKSFGRILLKVTGIGAILPTAAGYLKQAADYFNAKGSGFSLDVQVFKEQAASLFMSAQTRAAELQTMRAQYTEQERINAAAEDYAKWTKEQAEAQKKKEDLITSELEAYSKSLSAKMDALDPAREEIRIAEQLKSIKDPFLRAEIELRRMAIKEMEQQNQLVQDMIEDVEEYYRKLGEAQEFSAGPITKAQAEQEKMNGLIAEARKLVESQVPEVQKLADMYARSREAFLAGNMTDEEYQAVSNEYGKALAEQNKAEKVQLAGATTGTDAYSAIVNGIANQTTGDTPQKQLQTQMSIDKELKKQTEYQKKLANGQGYINLRVLTLGGA